MEKPVKKVVKKAEKTFVEPLEKPVKKIVKEVKDLPKDIEKKIVEPLEKPVKKIVKTVTEPIKKVVSKPKPEPAPTPAPKPEARTAAPKEEGEELETVTTGEAKKLRFARKGKKQLRTDLKIQPTAEVAGKGAGLNIPKG